MIDNTSSARLSFNGLDLPNCALPLHHEPRLPSCSAFPRYFLPSSAARRLALLLFLLEGECFLAKSCARSPPLRNPIFRCFLDPFAVLLHK